jgi:hypothetical protein
VELALCHPFGAQKFGVVPSFFGRLWTHALLCDTKVKYFEYIVLSFFLYSEGEISHVKWHTVVV